jgi:hypothetical protein
VAEDIFDVCVIGTGAGGGVMLHELTWGKPEVLVADLPTVVSRGVTEKHDPGSSAEASAHCSRI